MMKTQTGNDSLECQLKNIIDQEPDTIRAVVAQEALDAVSECYPIESWFNDLLSHGCICGVISSLIYYQDTAAFLDKYYEDIIWLKTEYEESISESMEISHQIKKFSMVRFWGSWLYLVAEFNFPNQTAYQNM